MNKEEFLSALRNEGLLIYGTPWLENFKHIQELKKYKDMWEEFEEMFRPGKVFYICKNKNFQEHAQKIMDLKYIIDELKQKYFPEKELEKRLKGLLELVDELMKALNV